MRYFASHANILWLLSIIWPVQIGDAVSHSGPLHLSSHGLAALNLLELFPLEQFVRESKVRLNDHIESTGTDEATVSLLAEP